jgi:hypothetical protein
LAGNLSADRANDLLTDYYQQAPNCWVPRVETPRDITELIMPTRGRADLMGVFVDVVDRRVVHVGVGVRLVVVGVFVAVLHVLVVVLDVCVSVFGVAVGVLVRVRRRIHVNCLSLAADIC